MYDEDGVDRADGGAGRADPPGRRVIEDRYELREPIGSGGMGEVWKAYDRRLRRFVAVKGLLDSTAMTPDRQRAAVQRARREAEALAKIEHQNVVTVHDQIETADQVWIVMKLLEARSLADLLKSEEVLGVPRAARIALQMAQGLRAVHEASVLHRDVKPANVLVREGGQVVLVDFGIATFEGADRVTRYGGVIGTPPYLAPELFAPASPGPTPASDLWALGVTLYEMVEGRLPYAGREVWQVQENILQNPDPVLRYAGPLGPVIQGLLVTDPARRLDAAATEALLQDVLEAPTVSEAPAAASTRTPQVSESAEQPPPAVPAVPPAAPDGSGGGWSRGAKVAAGVVCAALLAGGGWFLLPDGSDGGGGSDAKAAREKAWTQWKSGKKRLAIGAKADQPGLSEYDRATKTWSGFDIDMALAVAGKLGFAKKDVDFYPVTTGNRGSELNNDNVDLVVASYSMTAAREKKEHVSFVGPYYKAGSSLLVRRRSANYDLGEASDVKEHGVEVCTARDSTYADRLTEEGYRTAEYPPDTYRVCVKRLLDPRSKVYAVASDDVLLAGYAEEDAKNLKLLPSGAGSEPYGIAVKQGGPVLTGKVCAALRSVLTAHDGKDWSQMYMKHLSRLMQRRTAPSTPQMNATCSVQ
jgi:ABC-type amino acid transport substrate-binding protein